MFSLILSSLIITAEPNEPTKIIGSANTPDGQRKEVIVEQPYNSPNPFGYIASENNITNQTNFTNLLKLTKKSPKNEWFLNF